MTDAPDFLDDPDYDDAVKARILYHDARALYGIA